MTHRTPRSHRTHSAHSAPRAPLAHHALPLAPAALAGWHAQYTPASPHGMPESLLWVRDRAPDAAPWAPRVALELTMDRADPAAPWRAEFAVGTAHYDGDRTGHRWYLHHAGVRRCALEAGPAGLAPTDDGLRALGMAAYLRHLTAIAGMCTDMADARAAARTARTAKRADARATQGAWERDRAAEERAAWRAMRDGDG